MNVVYKYHQWLPLKWRRGFQCSSNRNNDGKCSSSGTACAVPTTTFSSNPGTIQTSAAENDVTSFHTFVSPIYSHALCYGTKRTFSGHSRIFWPYYLNWRPKPQPALLGEMLFWARWFKGGWGCTFLQIAHDYILYICPADKAPTAKHCGTTSFLSTHVC